MEEKTSMNQYLYQNYLFKWKLENQSGLIFAAVYQEVLQLIYVDEFIEMLKSDYMEKAYPKIEFRDGFLATLPDYDRERDKIMQKWQENVNSIESTSQMRNFGNTSKVKRLLMIKQKEIMLQKNKQQRKKKRLKNRKN